MSLEQKAADLEQKVESLLEKYSKLQAELAQVKAEKNNKASAGVSVDAVTKAQLNALVEAVAAESEADKAKIAALEKENAKLSYRIEFLVREYKIALGKQ